MKKWTQVLLTSFLATQLAYASDPMESADLVIKAPSTPQISDFSIDGDVESIYLSKETKITPTAQHEDNAQLKYVIEAKFPQIAGGKLSENEKDFNKQIRNLVTTEINQFKKYVIVDQSHMQTLPEQTQHNTLKIDYDLSVVKPNKQPIISVRLGIEGMQAGRAHPYHVHRIFNYDLEKGKSLSLGDIFKPRAKYIKVFAKYSNKKFNETLADKFMIAAGTAPDPKNFTTWNIEEDGILLTFDEYKVAPYSYGVQEVRIPYSELAKLISPKSPLSTCVKNSAKCLSEDKMA